MGNALCSRRLKRARAGFLSRAVCGVNRTPTSEAAETILLDTRSVAQGHAALTTRVICPVVSSASIQSIKTVTLGEQGRHVVKDSISGDCFHFGAVEAFLLKTLDGQHTSARIRAAFEAEFDDALTEEELADFVELAKTRGFLQTAAPYTGDETQTPR